MKKILIILFCCLSTSVFAKDLQFKCEKVKGKDTLAYFSNTFGSLGLNKIVRCENDEVICYITSGETNDNISCKWKE